MEKLGFIGCGNLAGSIVKGLRQSGSPAVINLFDLFEEKPRQLAEQYQAKVCTQAEVIRDSDVIVLAIKPKDIPALLAALGKDDLAGKLLITVAAGIGLEYYERKLPGTAVVRVMPNTSAAVLHSVSALARGKKVSESQAKSAEKVFSALGKVLWVKDEEINAVTAVSGSGPAYFYLLAEYMAQAGEKLGLSKEQATLLAVETLVGAGKMLAQTGREPAELRKAVTSPNGTTSAAICSFEQAGLEGIVWQALQACQKRAEEMEEEYSE
ncbi:pyrroline-5-carboxylate reductase [Syntrophobotulus glycolicus DSM 8271]|uniref:Pyrroline-5-carboxylate reductase n=1 Tax=Syntrophobotulus glycolicus (strain DSM 8271 / FlGlyR) TaxID=645991 RepID=F0T2P1_SYNGF|nr:pyrroline-5-carboxylate reductase [Syntrophobotulus glycolicus]ADY56440.1 pyrroline-5-carboxylate reductase [Syntrophobotulus glycolicus DSM 8271]